MEPKKPWYKRYGLPLAFIGISALAIASDHSTAPKQPVVAPIVQPAPATYQKTAPVVPAPKPQPSPLSNNNYYINVDGNRVHSPAYSRTVPSGASARCGDGTYSFSQHRQGTCSRHGGVDEWL